MRWQCTCRSADGVLGGVISTWSWWNKITERLLAPCGEWMYGTFILNVFHARSRKSAKPLMPSPQVAGGMFRQVAERDGTSMCQWWSTTHQEHLYLNETSWHKTPTSGTSVLCKALRKLQRNCIVEVVHQYDTDAMWTGLAPDTLIIVTSFITDRTARCEPESFLKDFQRRHVLCIHW